MQTSRIEKANKKIVATSRWIGLVSFLAFTSVFLRTSNIAPNMALKILIGGFVAIIGAGVGWLVGTLVVANRKTFLCPKCKLELLKSDEFCPSCGINIRDFLEGEHKEYICPFCETDIEMNQKYCANCGAEIDWGEDP